MQCAQLDFDQLDQTRTFGLRLKSHALWVATSFELVITLQKLKII